MTNIVKIRVCTSKNECEKLKTYMRRYPFYYEIIPDVFIEAIDTWVYYIRMDVGCYALDIDFLINMKEHTKSEIAIIGNPGELP